MAAVGTQQPSDHVQDTRLARPRRAEQRGEDGAGREARGDQAVAASLFDVDLNRHGAPVRHGCGAPAPPAGSAPRATAPTTGRASCRGTGWQYVLISVVAVILTKKNSTIMT